LQVFFENLTPFMIKLRVLVLSFHITLQITNCIGSSVIHFPTLGQAAPSLLLDYWRTFFMFGSNYIIF
jgi:hypothetical protein